MKLNVFAAALILVSGAASAQSMNAQQFYKRAAAIQNKGMLAVFSMGEAKALIREAQAAGKQAGENSKAAKKAGKTPRFCPPKGEVKMNDKEFMARLSAIPAAERSRIDMTEAMTRMLAAKFPCRS